MTEEENDFIQSRRKYERHRDLIDNDAEKFREYVNDSMAFAVCAICAYEGPSVQFVLLVCHLLQ